MKYLIIVMLFLNTLSLAQELKIRADSVQADEKKGYSLFLGSVNIVKKNDELNASKVTIYTDKKHKPTKFVATGDVKFNITTETGSKYSGKANRVVYLPKTKEYQFYENVTLKQLDDKKEIHGDEVILNTNDGKAYAKGLTKEPVIMIFDIDEKE